tara:strand:+ start:164 stop:343 length:180 start_codon:yes stop_codon:yes gene_type:complete
MMKKVNINSETAGLKSELSKLKKENKILAQKLEKSKSKTEQLKKELKKNVDLKTPLPKE